MRNDIIHSDGAAFNDQRERAVGTNWSVSFRDGSAAPKECQDSDSDLDRRHISLEGQPKSIRQFSSTSSEGLVLIAVRRGIPVSPADTWPLLIFGLDV